MKTYYRFLEQGENFYEVLRLEDEDLDKQYDLQGLITAYADESEDIWEYTYNNESFELLEGELEDYIILDPDLVPERISVLIEYYNGDLEEYNEEEDGEITEEEVQDFFKNIDKYKYDTSLLDYNTIVQLWDGSNWRTFVLESPWYDLDWEEDEEGMFDNLETLDWRDAGVGYKEYLVKNDKNIYIETISQHQGDLTITYLELNDLGVETLEEAKKEDLR